MPATSINASDLSEMGLQTEVDLATADAAHLDEISANDPFMADLLASMEQNTPSAADLAKAIDRGPVADDGDKPAEVADTQAAATGDPLAKPGEVATAPVAPAPAETNGDQTPAAATAAGAAAPVDTPTAISDTFIVDIGNGQTDSIDTARAQRLLGLEAWAATLQAKPELLNAMQAVENGHAVAIPASQYEQFRVWLAGGQGQAPSAVATPASTPAASTLPALDEYADDTTKALYAGLQATQQELAALRQSTVDSQREQYNAQLEAHLATRAATFESTFTAAATDMGLSPAEANQALAHASNSRLIQSVNEELAARHPLTGAIIGESDPASVARTTFERAVYQLPHLRQRVIDAEVQSRLDSERASITSINTKKNRAASLSSAPTAATTSNRDPRNMTLQEREAGIAAELRAAMSA